MTSRYVESLAEIFQAAVATVQAPPLPPSIARADTPLGADDRALLAAWFRRLVRDAAGKTNLTIPTHVVARIASTFDAERQP